MKIQDDFLIMSDGTQYYANLGIVGLSPGGKIFGGYDSNIAPMNHDGDMVALPNKHVIEIAEHMAMKWQTLAWALRKGE